MKNLYLSLLALLFITTTLTAQIKPTLPKKPKQPILDQPITNIVGGTGVNINQVPWQVLLEIGGQDGCGGSIIAPNWILTAAHCVQGVSLGSIRVIAGITNRSQKNTGQIVNVAQVIIHPSYGTNPNSINDNDLALLRLTTPVTFNANVQAIPYATQADANAGLTNPGVNTTVSGWGLLSETGAQPDQLQSVNVPIVANATAAAQYDPRPENLDVTANMLAAGLNTGGRDACSGDSGGPLTVRNATNQAILAGIVSYGIGCARPNFLGVYTRVSRYCQW